MQVTDVTDVTDVSDKRRSQKPGFFVDLLLLNRKTRRNPVSSPSCTIPVTLNFYEHPKLSRVEIPVTGLIPSAFSHIIVT